MQIVYIIEVEVEACEYLITLKTSKSNNKKKTFCKIHKILNLN